ncbi:MAG: CHAD domain-containing protein [Acidimicrobiales bacterium]|jgi:CHAD domain-containing protein
MTSEPLEDDADDGSEPSPAGRHGQSIDGAELIPEPTAGMVLHRVLAMSARAFLLNDRVDEFEGGSRGTGTVDALSLSLGTRPLWAQSTVESLSGTERCDDPTERIHQTRVAMRQIRSNLRTFRLLLDPAWGTSLRAELAWYGDELGRSRDLDLLAVVVSERGPEVLDADEVARLLAVVDWRRGEVADRIAAEQASSRRVRLTEQMKVLWDGPQFKAKAARPAAEVLAPMLHRSWRDVRGAGRTARKDPTAVHLHQLRIRLKDLRYGSETLALVEGGPAAKTAKAAKNLQNKLGDLHDTVVSIDWLEHLAGEQPDLADAAERLAAVQRDVAADTRKGWKRGLKDVERRWRRWQG